MNSRTIQRTIEIAKALCPLNLEHRCTHIGTNSCRTHPETLNYDYKDHQLVGIHAELSVCMKSGKENLRDYKMVVLRVDRNGNLANSKPCCGCQSVIKQFNIGEVWHSDSNGSVVKNS